MLAHLYRDPQTGHHSLRATAPLRKGEVLCPFSALEWLDHATRFTLQLDEERHILLSPEPLWYTNHSCSPNIFFDTERMEVVCLQDIREGEELCFFYPSTEWAMAEPFKCVCGKPECLGWISGAVDLPDEVLERYELCAYVVKKWEQRKRQNVQRLL
jgi:hypothetical protein